MRANNRALNGSGHRLLLGGVAVVAYLLLVWFISRPFIAWLKLGKGSEEGILAAAAYDRSDPLYPYLLGRYYQFDAERPDIERAVRYYRQSLALNPLRAGVWVDLSRAYQSSGRGADAEQALEKAVDLNPNDSSLLWEAGVFWVMNDMTDRAVNSFRKYLYLEPERQGVVYDLCWRMRPDNDYILSGLVPEEYSYRRAYLKYLIRTKRAEEAQAVWNTIDKSRLDQDTFVSYVDFLIGSGLYESGERAWKEVTSKMEKFGEDRSRSLVWNSGFEHDPLNGGFDWVLGTTDGVELFLDDSVHMMGNRSLGVTFNGGTNPGITIARQIVPVQRGQTYTLKGYIKTDSLSTQNGIFISAEGYRCDGLFKKSDVITGTTFWKAVSLQFDAPQDCGAVSINIKRDRSDKLDNKIAGSAWIDDISLTTLTKTMKTASKGL